MHPRPELIADHPIRKRPKISVLLIDWAVRESFHSLHYLNRQTANRDDYELVWIEFHDHKPQALRQMVADTGSRNHPGVDRWMTLGYPTTTHYHKHRMYNVGLLLARGDICVICDSDAVFAPTFIEKLIKAFEETSNAVIHLDEARNTNPNYYPFNYPSIEQILGEGTINWQGHTTLGLDNSPDMLHHANYGACMAARRSDLLAVGGADEDLDYLGYVCGPYDLTFRLANYGVSERWLRDEFLYHTWHPNQYGWNEDYQGPHDGFHLSMAALEARGCGRINPIVRNPWLTQAKWLGGLSPRSLLRLCARRPEPSWDRARLKQPRPERAYWMEKDYFGFNLFLYSGSWYALRTDRGHLDAQRLQAGGYPEIWQANSQEALRQTVPIDYHQWSLIGSHIPFYLRVWRKAMAEPSYQLPGRLVRKAYRMMCA